MHTKTKAAIPDGFITPKEAATMLGVSPQSFYKYIRKYDLPIVEIGACKRYISEDFVREWLHGQRKVMK